MKNHSIGRRDFLKRTAAATGVAGLVKAAAAASAEAPSSTEVSMPMLNKALQWGNLPKELSDGDKLKMAKRCGWDGIEAYPMADLDAAQRLGETARAEGLVIHSVTYGGWGAPMSDPDPAVIEKGLKEIENGLRSTKAMGADTMLLVPAVVNEKVTYDGAYERSQQNIRRLLPLAQELGIIIGVENVWNKFLLSPLEFARYVDEFESPWLRAYFDVGNVVAYGWPEQWIRILNKRIVKVHLKDFKRTGGHAGEWKALREGDVDWPEVRRALDEVGYAGWVTTEVGGGDEAFLKDLAGRVDKIIAGE